MSGRHDHLSWTGWENWLPTNKENNQGENGNNHYIPLSPSEQAKLRYRRNRAEKKDAGKPKENSQSKSSKTTTEKSGAKDRQLKEGKLLNDHDSREADHRTYNYRAADSLVRVDNQRIPIPFPNVKMDFNIFELEMFLKPVLKKRKWKNDYSWNIFNAF